jgi:hypothetical protein
MIRLRDATLLLLGAAALAGAPAAAAVPVGYSTPAQAASALLGRSATVAWIERHEGGPALRHPVERFAAAAGIRRAACRGVGRPRAGAYVAFRCAVTYAEAPSRTVATATLYTRVWPGRAACVSPVTLADCPPPPTGPRLAGDPRCSISSAICMSRAARAATAAALRARHARVPEGMGCFALRAFVYDCSWEQAGRVRSSTVAFVRGTKRWTVAARVAPAAQG